MQPAASGQLAGVTEREDHNADTREVLHGRSARAEPSPGGMLKSQSLQEKQDPSGVGSVGQSGKREEGQKKKKGGMDNFNLFVEIKLPCYINK